MRNSDYSRKKPTSLFDTDLFDSHTDVRNNLSVSVELFFIHVHFMNRLYKKWSFNFYKTFAVKFRSGYINIHSLIMNAETYLSSRGGCIRKSMPGATSAIGRCLYKYSHWPHTIVNFRRCVLPCMHGVYFLFFFKFFTDRFHL